MKKRTVFSVLFLSILADTIYGLSLPANIAFYPKISAAANVAEGSLNNFSKENIYRSRRETLTLPFTFFIYDNIYAEAEYFARADYNNSDEHSNTYKFSKYNLNYQTDNIYFKLGRQFYAPQDKEDIIYYGNYDDKDNRLPSALEGISHGANTKYLAYSAIAAKEVQSLSPYDDNSSVYGAQAVFKPFKLFNFEGFYYGRNTNVGKDDINLRVYGTGFDFNIPQSLDLSLYAAFNGGEQAHKIKNSALDTNYNGRAIIGKLEILSQNYFGDESYCFKFFYGTDGKNKMPFTSVAANIDNGYIFGGNDILNSNYFDGKVLTSSVQPHAQDIKIYSLKIRLTPAAAKHMTAEAGIYNFFATGDATQKNLGREADCKLSWKGERLGINLLYGFFTSGSGLAEYTRSQAAAGKNINKAGLSADFEF